MEITIEFPTAKFAALSRISANYCFCIALASLAVSYPFYFIFSTFFLIITASSVNISDVSFWFKFKRLQEI